MLVSRIFVFFVSLSILLSLVWWIDTIDQHVFRATVQTLYGVSGLIIAVSKTSFLQRFRNQILVVFGLLTIGLADFANIFAVGFILPLAAFVVVYFVLCPKE